MCWICNNVKRCVDNERALYCRPVSLLELGEEEKKRHSKYSVCHKHHFYTQHFIPVWLTFGVVEKKLVF